MSAKATKSTKEKGKEAAKPEGQQDPGRICECMPSGEMPACCGPQMKEMMTRFMAQFQAAEVK